MRTSDPNLMSQVIFGHMSGHNNIYQATQHQGIYLAYVVDTHTNNPEVQEGTVRFAIPYINANAGWTAAPFPGTSDPPLGTECVVGFEGTFGNAPRILTFTNWQPGQIITISDTAPTHNNVGDLWIQP